MSSIFLPEGDKTILAITLLTRRIIKLFLLNDPRLRVVSLNNHSTLRLIFNGGKAAFHCSEVGKSTLC